MTKKDYIRAAAIVATHLKAARQVERDGVSNATSGVFGTIEAFVTFFREGNDRFDGVRFREACDPETYPVKKAKRA